ncbi:hypothetical protein [Neptuniibacter sp. QD48_11]|uniref:hypothetical protein n=1 Tax=Neptuniibacter sp. QD48_11 TaxID=3398211 RepID=UPI0039F5E6C0
MIRQGLTSNVTRIAVIALLLVATLSRASWAVQISQHDTAPEADPWQVALEHGHYHPPALDHMHDESSGISEDDHPFIHTVMALDHQLFIIAYPERPQVDARSTYPTLTLNTLPPYQRDLYRPPRRNLG